MKIVLGIFIFAAIAYLLAYLAARREAREETSEAEYRKGVDTGCLG